MSAIFFVAELWAAAGAEEHAPSIAELIFPLINFLIFAYIVWRYGIPFLRSHLRSRREQILASVESAAESQKRARALLEAYRGRLARLNEEMRKVRDELREGGEREKARLLRQAEELSKKIRAEADWVVDQEVRVARQEVREELARRARAAAEQLVKAHLAPSDQRRLVQDFLSRVGEER